MSGLSTRTTHSRSLAAAAVLAAIGLGGCGEKDEPPAEPPAAEADGDADTPARPEPNNDAEGRAGASEEDAGSTRRPEGASGSGPAESASTDPRLTAAERAAAAAVRSYVAAIDARDGMRLCELLAPGALADIELPRERGGCAASLSASIGYRDPRGLPVFDRARLAEMASIELAGDGAKVIATVVTTFADRTEPSIEDDIVYLERAGTSWAVAKPSTTLYRAIGIADFPPSVLTPP